MRGWGLWVMCVVIGGCSLSVGTGTGAGVSSSHSRSWGNSSGPHGHDLIEDLDSLERYCKQRAEHRLRPGGNGSFRWKANQKRRGDWMQFTGTVHADERGLQVHCQARQGDHPRDVQIDLQRL